MSFRDCKMDMQTTGAMVRPFLFLVAVYDASDDVPYFLLENFQIFKNSKLQHPITIFKHRSEDINES